MDDIIRIYYDGFVAESKRLMQNVRNFYENLSKLVETKTRSCACTHAGESSVGDSTLALKRDMLIKRDIAQFGESMVKQFNVIFTEQYKRAIYTGPLKVMYMDMFNLNAIVNFREHTEFIMTIKTDFANLVKKYESGAELSVIAADLAKIASDIHPRADIHRGVHVRIDKAFILMASVGLAS